MRTSTAAIIAITLLTTATSALHLVPRDSPAAVVNLHINRKHVQDPAKRDQLRRRQTKTVSQTLDNEVSLNIVTPVVITDEEQATLYFANVSLGTPGQQLRLHIDTGSSDLWANSPNSKLCQDPRQFCQISGTYDPSASSSSKVVSNDFNISYLDGSGATGNYMTDTLAIGGQNIRNLQFGLGLDSTSPEGILGIGYPSNEVQVNRNGKKAYSNLPQAMADANLIQSSAFSLWLDDLEANTGNILFGGIDTQKFHGTLSTLPIQPEFNTFAEFIITLTGLSLTQNGQTQTFNQDLPTPVLFDSGSSLTYLPNDLTQAIFTGLKVTYDGQQQTAYCDCRLADTSDTLDFTFTNPKISVPMSELAINPGPNPDGSIATFDDGTPLCIFGISPADGTTAVLGDTFIRSAYLVYDLGNNEISIGQTNFNATDSNVMEIGTGSAAVPSATVVPNPVQAQVSQTGGARVVGPTASGTITGGGHTSTPTSKSAAPSLGIPHACLLALGGAAAVAFACA